MNLYVNLNTFKGSMGISSTSDDAEMLRILDAVSREADDICRRHFYSAEETRYFTPQSPDVCICDDLLSVSSVYGDLANNETYSEALTAGEHILLTPVNKFPKTAIMRAKSSVKSFYVRERYLKVTGVFGYGNGRNAEPWRSTSLTGTLDSASDTTLALSAAGGVYAGVTLKLGAEQMYVESITGTTATVIRGMNGTTAAAHTAASVKIAEYPPVLTNAVLGFAASLYNLKGKQGLKDIMIGEYRETLVWDDKNRDHFASALGKLKKAFLCAV